MSVFFTIRMIVELIKKLQHGILIIVMEVDIKNKLVITISTKSGYAKFTDRTDKVMSVEYDYGYDLRHNYYKLTMKPDGKVYTYNARRVIICSFLGNLDTNKYYFIYEDKRADVIKVEKFEHNFYRLTFSSGKTKVTNELKIITAGQTKDIFAYYKSLADYALQVTEDDDPLHLLANNYNRINYNPNSALHRYFDGKTPSPIYNDTKIILPFSYNESQLKAIRTALNAPISVIEGPPGTGKTETILNLIANIIIRDQKCAVVSSNNTATENVTEKLSDYGYDFLFATLGSRDNKDEFFSTKDDNSLKRFLSNSTILPIGTDFSGTINAFLQKLKRINQAENNIANYKDELEGLVNEEKKQNLNYENKYKIRENLSSDKYKYLSNLITEKEAFSFRERIKLRFTYHLRRFNPNNANKDFFDTLDYFFYQARKRELNDLIEKESNIASPKNKKYYADKIHEYSVYTLEDFLDRHYRDLPKRDFDKSNYKRHFDLFLNRYPVVTSTTNSIMNTASSGFMFDYLIIDESSQVDLLSSVLAMNCAKRIVIVGDSKQLQQIDDDRLIEKSLELASEMNIPGPYVYDGTNSILKSIKNAIPNVPTTLLKEHYRCAPDIIRFCNKMFYNNELIPLTDNHNQQHLYIIKTVEGNHARRNPHGRGQYNQREIDEILSLTKGWNSEDYGIITPFCIQSDMIQRQINDKNVLVSTVHKFQGQQRNKIVLSFVVNSLEKWDVDVENRLYDFITNEKLLNVALSRAKDEIYIIVSDGVFNSKNNVIHDLIRYVQNIYHNATISTSEIVSVFDYLYADNNDFYKKLFASKNYDSETNESELLMANLIDSILLDYKHIQYVMHTRLSKSIPNQRGFTNEECTYLNNPRTHTDFMFYNIITKEPLFVIEVDGIRYHEQNDEQLIHDQIKDRALLQNNIPVYRFKTNESNEKDRIISILSSYTY